MTTNKQKGRPPRGSSHAQAKLVEWQVADIRKRSAAGESTTYIAEYYGISIAACSNIINRKTWKHITDRAGDSVLHPEEYHIWNSMIQRCHNPKHISYKEYGARGIEVCTEWRRYFQVFLRDVGKRPSKEHSLDRKDPNKGYEPGNVQWATAKHQARNKRKSLYLEYPEGSGNKVPAAEVAEKLGLTYHQLRYKYKKEGKWPTV